MTILCALCELRDDLTSITNEIQDSYDFDSGVPNSQIRTNIADLMEKYRKKLASRDMDQGLSSRIKRILDFVEIAHDQASERSPRSSIREWLLRTILLIDDVILPVPMHEYVKHIKRLV